MYNTCHNKNNKNNNNEFVCDAMLQQRGTRTASVQGDSRKYIARPPQAAISLVNGGRAASRGNKSLHSQHETAVHSPGGDIKDVNSPISYHGKLFTCRLCAAHTAR